jgi:hypothetical protein
VRAEEGDDGVSSDTLRQENQVRLDAKMGGIGRREERGDGRAR